MKNRNLPFGYRYENCCIVVEPAEASALKQIFRDYLDGRSLLNIAKRLNAEQIAYMPGVIGWNKARIMRIIEDRRYLGGSGYPSLIDEETYLKLQRNKAEKYKLKDLDRQADIFKLNVPVLCPNCGTQMLRRHESRNRCADNWNCQNRNCHTIVHIDNDTLIGQITAILNRLIQNPEIIRDTEAKVYETNNEIRKIENEIGRAMDLVNPDLEVLKARMFECISLKYKSLPTELNTAIRLRMDFEARSPLAVFSSELTNRTVSAIKLAGDGTVELTLRNGQTLRKE